MLSDKEDYAAAYDLLKTGYIQLMNEKDVLLNWGKPQLEALYATKIGLYQIERLKQQLQIKSLKRKIELVQSAINTAQLFNVNEIELKAAEELAMAEAAIMGEVAKLERARLIISHLDTTERSAELRVLYKQLAKKLHPDVNPSLTSEQSDVWHLVKAAYETGDLDNLKALQLVYQEVINRSVENINELNAEILVKRNETLKEAIKQLHDEIRLIQSDFPFTIEAQINNEDWVQEQVDEIKADLEKLGTYEKELQQHYTALINSNGN